MHLTYIIHEFIINDDNIFIMRTVSIYYIKVSPDKCKIKNIRTFL